MLETHPESDLVPVTCETCGEGNVLTGDANGCPDCKALLDLVRERTGHDMRKEA